MELAMMLVRGMILYVIECLKVQLVYYAFWNKFCNKILPLIFGVVVVALLYLTGHAGNPMIRALIFIWTAVGYSFFAMDGTWKERLRIILEMIMIKCSVGAMGSLFTMRIMQADHLTLLQNPDAMIMTGMMTLSLYLLCVMLGRMKVWSRCWKFWMKHRQILTIIMLFEIAITLVVMNMFRNETQEGFPRTVSDGMQIVSFASWALLGVTLIETCRKAFRREKVASQDDEQTNEE